MARCAGEIDRALAGGPINRDAYTNLSTVVHFELKRTIRQILNGPTHGFFRVILNMNHVGIDGWKGELVDHIEQRHCPAGVRRYLRLEVGNVVFGVAGGI